MADFVSAVWDEPERIQLTQHQMGMLRLSYTTHASTGNGTSTSTGFPIYGEVMYAVTNPTDAHSANFDILVEDEYGTDLILDETCHATTTEWHAATLSNTYFYPPVAGEVIATVTNAGNSKAGVLEIYYRW